VVMIVKKKNPMWNAVFDDDRMKEPDKFLAKHLRFAVEHEQKCVKMRLKQIEQYLDRISLLEEGTEYGDTFKLISCIHGIPFPKEEYERLKKIEEKKVKK
jgi:hypothetical protein